MDCNEFRERLEAQLKEVELYKHFLSNKMGYDVDIESAIRDYVVKGYAEKFSEKWKNRKKQGFLEQKVIFEEKDFKYEQK